MCSRVRCARTSPVRRSPISSRGRPSSNRSARSIWCPRTRARPSPRSCLPRSCIRRARRSRPSSTDPKRCRQRGHGRGGGMAKAVTIYGIKNCDTMKKARAWLDKHGVAYDFHDYKSAGIKRDMLEGWAGKVGWDALINRAGRTFRALPERDRVGLTEKQAIALMAAQPSMIKRPVLEVSGKLFVGFKPEQYE